MVTFADAKKIADEIVSEIHPLSIVVFGSVARDGVGNDLDLFVIIDDSLTKEEAMYKLHRRLKPYYKYFAIDEFIVERSVLQEHYRKGSPFINLIIKEGRSIYMKDIINEWILQGEEELKTSLYLLDGGFYKAACYHAQQAVEKSIKACLLSKGWDLEKIHNINRLVALCEEYNIKITISDDEIIFIDSIYKGRYPADVGLLPLGEPDTQDAIKITEIASRVVKEMKENIEQK